MSANPQEETANDGGGGVRRRQFVRAIATTGAAVGVARLSPIDGLLADTDDEVTITYGYARRDPDDPTSLEPRTKTVPGDWYRTVSRAFEIHRRLAEAELPGMLGSAVVPGSYDSPTASISVDVLPDAETVVRDRLGGFLDSIEFAVTRVSEPNDTDGDAVPEEMTYPGEIDGPGIPGGILCGNDESMSTLAPAMVDPDTGRRFFATSNHLYGNGDEHQGEPLYLFLEPENTVEIGWYERGFPELDFVYARPIGDREPRHRIDGLTPSRVSGQFTRIGLADLCARGRELQKIGARTGVSTGEIRGIDGVTCYSSDQCRHGQLRWGEQEGFSDGDSGSVSVAPDPERPAERLMVAGFNNARTWWPGQSFIWGTAAYHITDVYGYHF